MTAPGLDLVDAVREDIGNAFENGYDVFGVMTNAEIVEDLIGCTGGYEGVPLDALELAVGIVRKEKH